MEISTSVGTLGSFCTAQAPIGAPRATTGAAAIQHWKTSGSIENRPGIHPLSVSVLAIPTTEVKAITITEEGVEIFRSDWNIKTIVA